MVLDNVQVFDEDLDNASLARYSGFYYRNSHYQGTNKSAEFSEVVNFMGHCEGFSLCSF